MQHLLMAAAAALAGSSSAGDVLLENKTLSTTTNVGSAECGYRIARNGEVQTRSGGGFSSYVADADEWIFPRFSAVGDQYQVRFTKTSGTESLANDGVWLAITSDRTVSVEAITTADGTKTLTFTVEIRKGTGAVIDSATISLSSQVTSI